MCCDLIDFLEWLGGFSYLDIRSHSFLSELYFLITRPGIPTITEWSGNTPRTTELAPTMQPLPSIVPAWIRAPVPIKQLLPIRVSRMVFSCSNIGLVGSEYT